MINDIRQELIDNYNKFMINLDKNNIDKQNLGFMINPCHSMLFSILIHCMENVDIFNKTQLNNITHFIDKL